MSFALSLAADVVEVDPGATTPLSLTIVNQGQMADRFEVEIEGIDTEWRFIPVPTFSVEPGEARTEKAFLKPPRLPESVAGSYPFVVRVRSLESGETKTAQALLKLLPYHHLTMEIAPKKGMVSPTTKRNDFRLTLVNLGNSEHTLQLSAQDPDDRCAYEFENDQIVLAPGQQREVEVIANPKQTPLLSSGRLIGFSVFARSLNERNVSATTQAQLEQRSLLSPATLVAFVLLLAAVFGWWALRPQPTTIRLFVTPRHAFAGEKVQVRFNAENADRVHITMGAAKDEVYDGPPTNEPVSVTLQGEDKVLFFAEATKEGRPEVHDSVEVTIDKPAIVPSAVIKELKAAPERVKLGSSFILSWKVENATKVAIAPIADNLSPDLEQQAITPTSTGEQTYTFIAFNAEGTAIKKTVTVNVYDESDAQILLFTADPTTAKESDGGRTTLRWKTTNASFVQLKIGAENPKEVETEGSTDLNIGAKTTFTLIATDNKGRRATKKVTVNYEKTEIVIEPSTSGEPPTFPDQVPPITTPP